MIPIVSFTKDTEIIIYKRNYRRGNGCALCFAIYANCVRRWFLNFCCGAIKMLLEKFMESQKPRIAVFDHKS